MNQRDDFIGTYSILRWEQGDGLPGDLFAVGRPLKLTADGDLGCQLTWHGHGDRPHSLALRWTPLYGGSLIGTMVELKGAGTLLVEAGVELDAEKRVLQGTLISTKVTGGPGTFAAQSTLPPADNPR